MGLVGGFFQGDDLGMVLARGLRGARSDHDAVFDQDRSHGGIGAGVPHNLIGQFNGPLHVVHHLDRAAR